MRPTTIEELRRRHPDQARIDRISAQLLRLTREKTKSPDARNKPAGGGRASDEKREDRSPVEAGED